MISITIGGQRRTYPVDLRDALQAGRDTIMATYCGYQSCSECLHREACRDLTKAIHYLNDVCDKQSHV